MAEGSNWVEIVLLAMLAAFIGLRLVSVLGKRTGHEPVPRDNFRPGTAEVIPLPTRPVEPGARPEVRLPAGTDPALAPQIEMLIEAEPGFDPQAFLGKAKSAYRMILESFWSSNSGVIESLVSEEILEGFAAAIEAREGARLPNRIVEIDQAVITAAAMVGQMAEVTVRFVSRVTTGGDEPPAETADIWTFSRHIGSPDPAWLLIATDAED